MLSLFEKLGKAKKKKEFNSKVKLGGVNIPYVSFIYLLIRYENIVYLFFFFFIVYLSLIVLGFDIQTYRN